MIKRNALILSITTLFFLIVMIVATFFDFHVSLALSILEKGEYYSKNVFCIFFEILGELPLYLISSFSLSILLFYAFKKVKSEKIQWVFKALLFSIIAIFNAVCFIRSVNSIERCFAIDFSDVSIFFVGLLYGVCLSLTLFFLTGKINAENLKSLAIWSLIAIFTIVFSQIIVHFLKAVVGRVRFRTINYVGDESLFSEWYTFSHVDKNVKLSLKNLIGSDSYKSFPSGHTTGCASLLTLILLPKYVHSLNNPKTKATLVISSVLLTALVALSRIMNGAHYLSDVVVAIFLTLVLLALSFEIVEKKIRKKIEN